MECTYPAKRTKQRCHQAAIRGTKACRIHPKKPVEQLKAEGRVRLELAAFDLEGRATEVNSREFILELVGLLRDRVLLVSRLLGAAFRAELTARAAGGSGESDGSGDIGGGVPPVGPPGAGALVGHRFVLGAGGQRVAVGEATRGLAAYEQQMIELSLRAAKTAVDARLSEAQVDLLALLAGDLQRTIDAVLTGFGLDPGDPEVVRVVAERLATLEPQGEASGGGERGAEDG